MPTRFYPDTNVIERISSSWTPTEFDKKARDGGYILCLGHQTYELARSFLYNHDQEAVKTALAFLSEIECIDCLPTVERRIEAECYLARTGMSLITVMGPLARAATKEELWKLARGSADEATEFIAKREANVAKDKERVTELNQTAAERAKEIDPKRAAAIKTFEDLQKELTPGRAGWLKNFAKKKGYEATNDTMGRVLADPIQYPILNTVVSSQGYLYFITAFHKTAPGKDTLDDFRHLVESAMCDLFVTDDADLLKQSKRIRPFKPVASWSEFKTAFDSQD
jgi:hypothetical protein